MVNAAIRALVIERAAFMFDVPDCMTILNAMTAAAAETFPDPPT